MIYSSDSRIQAAIERDLDALSRAENYLRFQFEKVKPHLGKRILDVGAGIGNHLPSILQGSPELVAALEGDPRFRQRLSERFSGKVQVLEGDLESLGGRLESLKALKLDTIIAVNVLEHVKNDLQCLETLAQSLEPGGKLIVVVPASQFLYSALDKSYGHFRRDNAAGMKAYARKLQMNLVENRYFNVAGWVGWLVFNKLLGFRSIGTGVPLFDKLVPALTAVENALPAMPFGLSLLSVFEKTDLSLQNVCKNCGSKRFVTRYDFGIKTIIECETCQLMVINPFPTQDELKQVYNENYFSNQQLVSADVRGVYGYVDYIYERLNKQAGYKPICEKIRKHYSWKAGEPNRLLDFGCGLGYFLDSAHDSGFSVHGVEFNKYAIEYIRSKFAFPVRLFNQLEEYDHPFEVITLLDVIEHLEDPFGMLHRVNQKLVDGGILVINTMDSKSFVSRLLGKRLEDFRRIREHLFFFSRDNLQQILERAGFEVLETEFVGHTFELKHLTQRVKAISRPLGAVLDLTLKALPFLARANLYVNPRTKIVMYARKVGPSRLR